MTDKEFEIKGKKYKLTELGKKFDIFNIEVNLVGVNIKKDFNEKRKVIYKFGSKLSKEIIETSAVDCIAFAFKQMEYDMINKLVELGYFEVENDSNKE